MKNILAILAIGTFGAWQTACAADITGVITLKGAPPAEVPITPIMDNPDCAAMYNGKVPTTHFYVVGPNGEFADVVVSLSGVSGERRT